MVSSGADQYVVAGNVISGIKHHPDDATYDPASMYRAAGILTYNTTNSVHLNNTVWDSDAGISYAGGTASTEIVNNIIGPLTQPSHQIAIGNSRALAASVVSHNLIEGSVQLRMGGIKRGCDGAECRNEKVQALQAPKDFHLSAGSPAIDAGMKHSIYETFERRYGLDIAVDLYGTPRPQGDGIDIGAVEAPAGTPAAPSQLRRQRSGAKPAPAAAQAGRLRAWRRQSRGRREVATIGYALEPGCPLDSHSSMQTLRWYARRLGRMSPAEILWRGQSALRDAGDRVRYSAGLYPSMLPAASREFAEPLAAAKLVAMPVGGWASTPTADAWRQSLVRTADALVAHRFSFLNLENANLGDPIDWNRDHETGQVTPLGFAGAIDYREPASAGDAKLVWEPGRHLHLPVLGRAYRATGRPQVRDGGARPDRLVDPRLPAGNGHALAQPARSGHSRHQLDVVHCPGRALRADYRRRAVAAAARARLPRLGDHEEVLPRIVGEQPSHWRGRRRVHCHELRARTGRRRRRIGRRAVRFSPARSWPRTTPMAATASRRSAITSSCCSSCCWPG